LASRPQVAPQQAAPPQEPQSQASANTMPAAWASTPRNAPCPCGSGKRFKNCHGDVTAVARA
ncbi:MAG TPA: SEC-C metal-binding domain-containing protein, partial [Hyphomonadaceae bacterium]|nr:SEC-C metal-binding domain-containing protein [Hyphomonadaceae bacterium]